MALCGFTKPHFIELFADLLLQTKMCNVSELNPV